MEKNNIFEKNKYELKLTNFEGPLDLLIYLIDKNKMNIYDISIDDITRQYLQFLNSQKELDLEIASEFIVMATNLLVIKSKKLLPKEKEKIEDEGIQDDLTEEELVRKLVEYKKYKEMAERFREKIKIFSKRYYKNQEKIDYKNQYDEFNFSRDDIVNTYRKILEKTKNKMTENVENIKKIAVIDNYSVSQKVVEIYKELINKKKFSFKEKYSLSRQSKEEVIAAFSGMLELEKIEKISASQKSIFEDITISRKDDTLYTNDEADNVLNKVLDLKGDLDD